MESAGLYLITTTPFIRAICWILIHSLWIGAGVSLLVLIGLIATQKSSSVLRYWMLLGCLTFFLLATGFIGVREIQSINHLPGQNTQHTAYLLYGNPANLQRYDVLQLIDQYSGWIVLLWATFLFYRALRLFRSFGYVYRLRSGGMLLSDSQWPDRLKKLGNQLGIFREITILESGNVKVPVTVGHFKPVIIVPLGFFLQLPYAQVEAILFHELAHIYRRDYLINLLQTVADAIFFFNPGLLWLSALIREQREICCDDIVLAHTAQKSDYLKGLIAFAASEHTGARPVALLSLHGSLLARRLTRLIENRNQPLRPLLKAIAFMGLLALPFVGSLFPTARKKPEPTRTAILAKRPLIKEDTLPHSTPGKRVIKKTVSAPVVAQQETVIADTTFRLASIRFERSNEDMANRVMTVRDGNGNTYLVTVSQNELVGLKINDLFIPKSELPDHLPLLAKIDHAWNEARAAKQRTIAQGIPDDIP